ncbi:hypothetical protein K1719_027819 [Acacia pycnantha]|nr:hypothetical protein K1719_027819 [Acacia pycnantha]
MRVLCRGGIKGCCGAFAALVHTLARLQVVHTYREGNRCADKLANISFGLRVVNCSFVSPPQEVVSLLYSDFVGNVFPRAVLIHE